jgi:hypothetical protein
MNMNHRYSEAEIDTDPSTPGQRKVGAGATLQLDRTVVIDLGSFNTRVGFVDEELPATVFPTLVAHQLTMKVGVRAALTIDFKLFL